MKDVGLGAVINAIRDEFALTHAVTLLQNAAESLMVTEY